MFTKRFPSILCNFQDSSIFHILTDNDLRSHAHSLCIDTYLGLHSTLRPIWSSNFRYVKYGATQTKFFLHFTLSPLCKNLVLTSISSISRSYVVAMDNNILKKLTWATRGKISPKSIFLPLKLFFGTKHAYSNLLKPQHLLPYSCVQFERIQILTVTHDNIEECCLVSSLDNNLHARH